MFCSNINLDLLSTSEGYRHHPSCADLFQSSQNGCRSCRLIWGSQWSFYGGDLTQGYDLGPLDTQIIARVVWQKPGGFHSIRYGQEERWEYSKTQSSHKVPFLWTFLAIAAKPGSSCICLPLTLTEITRKPGFAVPKFARPSDQAPTRSTSASLQMVELVSEYPPWVFVSP